MDLKFCPSCGGDTLLRTSTSTNANGEVTVHLKKNMQWTNRGTKVPSPKLTHNLFSNVDRVVFVTETGRDECYALIICSTADPPR